MGAYLRKQEVSRLVRRRGGFQEWNDGVRRDGKARRLQTQRWMVLKRPRILTYCCIKSLPAALCGLVWFYQKAWTDLTSLELEDLLICILQGLTRGVWCVGKEKVAEKGGNTWKDVSFGLVWVMRRWFPCGFHGPRSCSVSFKNSYGLNREKNKWACSRPGWTDHTLST